MKPPLLSCEPLIILFRDGYWLRRFLPFLSFLFRERILGKSYVSAWVLMLSHSPSEFISPSAKLEIILPVEEGILHRRIQFPLIYRAAPLCQYRIQLVYFFHYSLFVLNTVVL